MERDPYSPSIVSLDGLTEAASVGVFLALQDQAMMSYSEPDPGTTIGYIPPEMIEP